MADHIQMSYELPARPREARGSFRFRSRALAMKLTAKPMFLFGIAIAVSAMGAPPSNPGNAPVGGSSERRALSAADRLGFAFDPAAKDGGSAVVDPRMPPAVSSISPDDMAPGTVILPPFVVTAPGVRLRDEDLLTGEARLILAEKKYLSPLYRATIGPLSQIAGYCNNFPSILQGWHPNEAEAMTLYREDKRLEMLSEFDSMIRLEMTDNAKEAQELRRLRTEEYIRSRSQ